MVHVQSRFRSRSRSICEHIFALIWRDPLPPVYHIASPQRAPTGSAATGFCSRNHAFRDRYKLSIDILGNVSPFPFALPHCPADNRGAQDYDKESHQVITLSASRSP